MDSINIQQREVTMSCTCNGKCKKCGHDCHCEKECDQCANDVCTGCECDRCDC